MLNQNRFSAFQAGKDLSDKYAWLYLIISMR
jgi:hypothetical protein